MAKNKSILSLILFSVVIAIDGNSTESSWSDISPERLSSLTKNGVLVHLTDKFPETGKLIAGSKVIDPDRLHSLKSPQYIADNKTLPNTRPTLHFTIDKAFTSHNGNPLAHPFAVLSPVVNVDKSRLRFGYYDDVIVVGDVDILTEGTVILVPEENMPGIKDIVGDQILKMIRTYNSNELTCRQAVDAWLLNHYQRYIIEQAEPTLEIFKGMPVGEIINNSFICDAMTRRIFSSSDLSIIPEFGNPCPFSSLGEGLKKLVPIEGSGYLYHSFSLTFNDLNTCFEYQQQKEEILAFVHRTIKINEQIVDAKNYFKESLGLELEWALHEDTVYHGVERSLNQLLMVYHILPYKMDVQNDELIKYYTGIFQKYFKETFDSCKRNRKGKYIRMRSTFKNIIEKLVLEASSKLQSFYDRELVEAAKITNPTERDNVTHYLEDFKHSNDGFIRDIKDIATGLAKGNNKKLNALRREMRTKLPELEIH